MRYTQPDIFKPCKGLIAVETTRLGGVSPAPYTSLNLGKNTEDSTEHIEQNRALLCSDLGIEWSQVAFGSQVHGNQVCHVERGGRYDGFDAFITNTPNVAVAITVADCTPILIYDTATKACGAAHAGWRGAAAQIATHTLRAMQSAFGTHPSDCLVYVGTCIGQRRFEVGSEVAARFDREFSRRRKQKDKYLLDLKGAISAELRAAGVPGPQLGISPFCTWEHNANYYSHRREQGRTGRFLALIGWFEP